MVYNTRKTSQMRHYGLIIYLHIQVIVYKPKFMF